MVLEQFTFVDFLESLEGIGFYEVALPFLLFFTIVFAVLQKIKLFGAQSKNFNVVIALAIAFFVIRVPEIINAVNIFLPRISFLIVILIMVLLLIGIFGFTEGAWSGFPFFIAIATAIFGVIWGLSGTGLFSMDIWPRGLQITSTDITFLVGLAVIGFIIMWLAGGKQQKENTFWDKLGSALGEKPGGKS